MKTVSVIFTRNVDNICRFLWIQKKLANLKLLRILIYSLVDQTHKKKDFFKQVFLSQKGFEYV